MKNNVNFSNLNKFSVSFYNPDGKPQTLFNSLTKFTMNVSEMFNKFALFIGITSINRCPF